MKINMQEIEALEEKYGVALYVEQEDGKKDEFYAVVDGGDYQYVGNSIKEVKKKLRKMYGC